MNLSDHEKKVLEYLVTKFSANDKPIPFHEDDLAIQDIPKEEIKDLIDGLYEKGLVFINEPEKDDTGDNKEFEKQPFVVAPDAIHKDYY